MSKCVDGDDEMARVAAGRAWCATFQAGKGVTLGEMEEKGNRGRRGRRAGGECDGGSAAAKNGATSPLPAVLAPADLGIETTYTAFICIVAAAAIIASRFQVDSGSGNPPAWIASPMVAIRAPQALAQDGPTMPFCSWQVIRALTKSERAGNKQRPSSNGVAARGRSSLCLIGPITLTRRDRQDG